MRAKIYLGTKPDGSREIFRSKETPTQETHGAKYNYTPGPFRTIHGATFMLNYGRNNPHCRTVSEAERLAKLDRVK